MQLFFLLGAAAATEPDTKPFDTEVRQTLSQFIQAFDNLDWEQFRGFFADDATVFYPREVPRRATGRVQIEAQFKKVFEQIRGGRSKPPYMDLQPQDLDVQIFGDVAGRIISPGRPAGSLESKNHGAPQERWLVEDRPPSRFRSSTAQTVTKFSRMPSVYPSGPSPEPSACHARMSSDIRLWQAFQQPIPTLEIERWFCNHMWVPASAFFLTLSRQ